MSEDERLAIWLDALLKSEPDLRPSRGVAKETRKGGQTPRIIILESGEFAIGDETPQVGQPTTGKLLINASSTSWSPTAGTSAVGVYGNVLDSNSATQSYVVVQKSGNDTSP